MNAKYVQNMKFKTIERREETQIDNTSIYHTHLQRRLKIFTTPIPLK